MNAYDDWHGRDYDRDGGPPPPPQQRSWWRRMLDSVSGYAGGTTVSEADRTTNEHECRR